MWFLVSKYMGNLRLTFIIVSSLSHCSQRIWFVYFEFVAIYQDILWPRTWSDFHVSVPKWVSSLHVNFKQWLFTFPNSSIPHAWRWNLQVRLNVLFCHSLPFSVCSFFHHYKTLIFVSHLLLSFTPWRCLTLWSLSISSEQLLS